MKYLTPEQQAVVGYRLSIGYDYQVMTNGNYRMWKGKHTMEINCLGYDCYVPIGNIDRTITEYYTDRANSSLANRAR